MKTELMLLGFVSLLLPVSERWIANICIPISAAETFLPCKDAISNYSEEETKCTEQGKVSLISREGVRQLQNLVFILAFLHSLSCLLTFSLGMVKMSRWKSWEAETRSLEYQLSNDPRRFRFIHQTSFGRRHLRYWSEHQFLCWPACFLRQFYDSVSKVDYVILRHGFIMAHFDEGSNFDFQRYIKRALEKDFGVVVGVSFWIWIFSVIFIIFNAHVFYNYLWLPFIPLVMLLLVGTKLQCIITMMCVDSHDKSQVVRGTLLVKPSDHFFWFGWPKLLLYLMHFILFQNSFQVAFFTWTLSKFRLRSCFHRETADIVIRLVMGVLVQILCGYVTLPLYALVTQMGSSMRKAVFTENVAKSLKRWQTTARKNVALKNYYGFSARPSVDASIDTSLSLDSSPSFGLDASYSVQLDHQAGNTDEHVEIEIADEENVSEQPELQRVKSFYGFNVTIPNSSVENGG